MKHLMLSAVVLLSLAGNVFAQGAVSPDRVAQIAKTVHDAEGWKLGSASTRETRNEFWARVMGIVHWGHPVYNPTPDPSWCLKDGGGGRPQTDDVATQCASRLFWDCIGGVGADGYERNFNCNGHGNERLPAVQNVYPPSKPAGGGASSGGGGTPTTPAPPAPAPVPADYTALLVKLDALLDRVATLTAKLDSVAGVAVEARDAAKSAEHDARELNAARLNGTLVPPLGPVTFPCMKGSVYGRGTRFCPE